MTPTEENNVNIMKRNNDKLSKSALYGLMSEFVNEVSKYPSAHIECAKDKRQQAVERACAPIYPAHTVFNVSFNDYGNSIILIANEMPVKYMALEAAAFAFHLENFYKEIKKGNSVQELQQYYKKFTLKPKQILDALILDLKQSAEDHKFELDIKASIAEFQAEKQRLTGK